MKIEVHSIAECVSWLKAPAPAVFQNIDLREFSDAIAAQDLADCSFLGCQLTEACSQAASKAGCIVIPSIPPSKAAPFDPFTRTLYTPEELYTGFDPNDSSTFETYFDRLIYLSYMDQKSKTPIPTPADLLLLRRLHDATVAEALDDFAGSKSERIVAIMGGHDRGRDEAIYRDVAYLSLQLTQQGYLVATGGGPGLMEAANLGAYAAGFTDPPNTLENALSSLSTAPLYNDPLWLKKGFEVWKSLGDPVDRISSQSIGIPTWFYGHEPPNVFATHIAKYFENSVREEGLLAIALGGIIFAEGNAGTVQELFQDACQNYYRTYQKVKSPMILLGVNYWNPTSMTFGDPTDKRKQVFQLLRKLSSEKGFEDYLHITDSVRDAVDFLVKHPPMK